MTPKNSREMILAYSCAFLGKPYIWGGTGPVGFDCSGFVLECLTACGLYKGEDMTAGQLLNYSRRHWKEGLKDEFGNIVFFGREENGVAKIKHCGLTIGRGFMIEAGGGGSGTTTPEKAESAQSAMVRIRPINNRKDFFFCSDPHTDC